ncbi:sulfatase [Lentisphaera marina]|uniref:sulfatase n=1 Tax=Lentisphaera marina TaxID=1111041 RepID=UPI0023669E2A|nr:sulfatase [Lentisphaera marina]MDD7983512.1 sulfatase [Lentisphaera marina]
MNKILLLVACFFISYSSFANDKPNVLFIAVDDYRDWAGTYNAQSGIKTPNIDALGNRGMTFLNAHCNAPICGPSRASLLSGLRPSSTGVYGFQSWKDQATGKVETLFGHFQKNGYATYGGGKLHHGKASVGNNGPLARDWNEYYPSIKEVYPRPVSKVVRDDLIFEKSYVKWFSTNATNDFQDLDGQTAEWAVGKLKLLGEEKSEQPFFLAVGFKKPHLPWIAPRKYFDMYDPAKIKVPNFETQSIKGLSRAGIIHLKYQIHEQLKYYEKTREAVRAYMACVSYIDALVGHVMLALDESGLAENTVVVLCSDHGFHLGEKGHWGKVTLYEQSTRVPLIVYDPRMKYTAHQSNSPVELLDIYPTLVELCVVDKPAHQLEGLSLVSQMKNPEQTRRPAVTTHGRNSHAITSEDYHYIRYFDGSEELFDRKKDPDGINNISDEEFSETIKSELRQYIPNTNAPNTLPCENPRYWRVDYPNVEKLMHFRKQFYKRDLDSFFAEKEK